MGRRVYFVVYFDFGPKKYGLTRVPNTVNIESAMLIVEIVTGEIEVHARITSSSEIRTIGKVIVLLVPITLKNVLLNIRTQKCSLAIRDNRQYC